MYLSIIPGTSSVKAQMLSVVLPLLYFLFEDESEFELLSQAVNVKRILKAAQVDNNFFIISSK